MSRSCQSATFSMPGDEVAAQHARQAAELLGLHRVALVRHRARALLRAGAERLLDLAHLGALEVADLDRERLDGRAERRARVEHLGVTVAAEHLRGRDRLEAELLAHVGLDRGVDVGVRAHRARELPHRDHVPGRDEPPPFATELQRPEGELGAERRGLGVDAVGAPDHRRCRGARVRGRAIAASSSSTAPITRSSARVSVSERAVSTTSLEVRP